MKVLFCASSAAALSPNLVLVVKICLFIYYYYYYNIAGSKINLNFTNSTQFIYIY